MVGVLGSVSLIVAGLFPINIPGELISIGALFAFLIVCVGVLVLRYRHPEIPRAFRTPWVPFVPIAGALVTLLQMVALPADAWIRLIAWMAIGLVIYFSYSRSHSRVRQVTIPGMSSRDSQQVDHPFRRGPESGRHEIGTAGRHASEQVVDIDWNGWSAWPGVRQEQGS